MILPIIKGGISQAFK